MKSNRLEELTQNYEALINRKNEICSNSNGIYKRYYYPVLTAEHAPLCKEYTDSSHTKTKPIHGRKNWYQRCNEYGSHQDQS